MFTDKKCETCGEVLNMYYRLWCPRCEKPEAEQRPVMNLLQAMYHVDRIVYNELNQNVDPPGKRAFWLMMCESNMINNDSYFSTDFAEWYYEMVDHDNDPDYEIMRTYMKNFIETFELEGKGNLIWEVSW